jgi:hypothetical protein
MLEGIYLHRLADGGMLASNSLTGLLSAAGLDLDPAVAYPPLFNESVDGVMHSVIPTLGGPIETLFHDNLRIDRDGLTTAVPKQREEVFTRTRGATRKERRGTVGLAGGARLHTENVDIHA